MYEISELKFSIKAKLNRLPKEDSQIAARVLYKKLGISRSCWFEYLGATISDRRDIPLTIALRLAKFFDCPVEDLVNFPIEPITIKELERYEKEQIAEHFKLSK